MRNNTIDARQETTRTEKLSIICISLHPHLPLSGIPPSTPRAALISNQTHEPYLPTRNTRTIPPHSPSRRHLTAISDQLAIHIRLPTQHTPRHKMSSPPSPKPWTRYTCPSTPPHAASTSIPGLRQELCPAGVRELRPAGEEGQELHPAAGTEQEHHSPSSPSPSPSSSPVHPALLPNTPPVSSAQGMLSVRVPGSAVYADPEPEPDSALQFQPFQQFQIQQQQQQQHLPPCSYREAQLYFLMGFRPGEGVRWIGGLG